MALLGLGDRQRTRPQATVPEPLSTETRPHPAPASAPSWQSAGRLRLEPLAQPISATTRSVTEGVLPGWEDTSLPDTVRRRALQSTGIDKEGRVSPRVLPVSKGSPDTAPPGTAARGTREELS